MPGRTRGAAPVAMTSPSNAAIGAVVERDGGPGDIERGRPHAEAEVEVELVVAVLVAQLDPVDAPLTGRTCFESGGRS